MAVDIAMKTNCGTEGKGSSRSELWAIRFLTYLLILAFIVGCAFLESVLIPQAIEANRKVVELESAPSARASEVIATHQSVRDSSWIMAFLCLAMLPPAFWALRLTYRQKYKLSILTISTCVLLIAAASMLFKPN